MAAATVLYVLNLAGDAAAKLPSLSAALTKIKNGALEAKVAVASIGTSGRAALAGLADEGGKAAEGAFKAGAGFAAAGIAVHTLLKNQEDYAQSTARLVTESKKLGTALAEAIGPKVASFIDSFTIGLVYIANLVGGVVGPAFGILMDLIGRFNERILVSIEAWKMIGRGDFAGAKEALLSHRSAWADMIADIKKGFDGIQTARDNAFKAAFEAWRRQTDEISDIAGEIRQSYASVAGTTEAGARVGAGGVGVGGTKLPTGQQVTERIGAEVVQVESPVQTAKTHEVVQGVSGVIGAVSGGTTAILGTLGPIGAFIGALLDILANIDGLIEGIQNTVFDIVTGLADSLDRIVGDLAVNLEKMLPKMVSSIALLIPQLIASIISSAPLIFAEAIKSAFAIPGMIIKGFGELFADFPKKLGEAIAEAIKTLGKVFTNDDGKFLGTSLAGKGNEGNRSFLGIRVPRNGSSERTSIETGGGTVDRSPPRDRPQHQARTRGDSGRTKPNIEINVSGIRDPDQLVREVRKRLGPYGVNLSLDPYGGR